MVRSGSLVSQSIVYSLPNRTDFAPTFLAIAATSDDGPAINDVPKTTHTHKTNTYLSQRVCSKGSCVRTKNHCNKNHDKNKRFFFKVLTCKYLEVINCFSF